MYMNHSNYLDIFGLKALRIICITPYVLAARGYFPIIHAFNM